MNILIAALWTLYSIVKAQQYELPLTNRFYAPSNRQNELFVAPYAPPLPLKNVEVLPHVFEAPVRKSYELGPLHLSENTKIDIRNKSGQYSHGFSADGTKVSEQGSLITTNGGWEYVIAKKGSYSYTSPEGNKISVNYIADHNGFRIVDCSNIF